MKRTPRLSKSGIEYLDYQWGIFSGCWNWKNGICPVRNCWAKGIAYRFHNHYPDGFNPHYYPEALESPMHLKKPSIIGVGWVGDVIGYGLEYKEQIYSTIEACSQHRFLFLTKNPDRFIDWSPFPSNCYIGVTITDGDDDRTPLAYMKHVEARVKFVSFEPLLNWWDVATSDMVAKSFKTAGINWVIIGAQTRPTVYPRIEWVEEVVRACDKAGISVFLKDNLMPLLKLQGLHCNLFWADKRDANGFEDLHLELRQEMPDG